MELMTSRKRACLLDQTVAAFAFVPRIAAMAVLAVTLLFGMSVHGAGTALADDDEILAALQDSSISEYRLGPNDRVRVTVYGEPDLSGEFEVDATGYVSVPLIGEIEASNLTVREFENRIEAGYDGDYLISPRVNAEVINYRPFFIVGEVTEAGQYPFEPGMTILKAVSTAGGYTYRANRRRVFITRKEISEKEVAVEADSAILIMPGDVIRVPERLF